MSIENVMTNDDDIVAEVLRRALCSKLNHKIQLVADSAATALRLKAEGWTKPVPRALFVARTVVAEFKKGMNETVTANLIRPMLGPEVDADGWIETPKGVEYVYSDQWVSCSPSVRKIRILGGKT